MPTGFPVPNMPDGTGAEPEDLQLIVAARYANAGILEGAQVTGGADWRYHVSRGAVVADVGAGRAVEVPVDEVYLTPDPAPATGTRTDTIYVVQHFPESGDNLAVVAVTTDAAPTVPSGAVVLDKRTVPAGATATSSTTSTYDRRYALLTGGTLGSLGFSRDTDSTPHDAEVITRGAIRTPNLPTDRLVDFQFTSTVSMSNASGGTPDAYWNASVLFKLRVDGNVRKSFEIGYSRMWETKQFGTTEVLTAGVHDIDYTVERRYFPTDAAPEFRFWAVRHGGPEQFLGNSLALFDRGPSS